MGTICMVVQFNGKRNTKSRASRAETQPANSRK